jgi:ParB/RepB/Spo0J family partition protein
MNLELNQLVLRYAPLRVMDSGRVARLATSMAQNGQKTPVIVVGEGVLVDGYPRVEALRSLHQDLVKATQLEMTEAEALVMTWRLETGRRKTALEEGWLLADLMERHDKTQVELSSEMQRSPGWISERLGLVRSLPESVQEAVRKCRVPSHGAMHCLVPMARQDREACERLVEALKARVTDRQLDRLWRAWRKANAEGRRRIEAQPELLLKAEEAVHAVPMDAEEELASALERIAGLCRRARQGVREGVFARAKSSLSRQAWEQARNAFEALTDEVNRVGS